MQDNRKPIKHLCRDLRKNDTKAEGALWQQLRNRKFKGLKFTRQYPFVYGQVDKRKLFFIADFYCAELKLVIELDGKVHEFQQEYDANRDRILSERGLKVLRFKNEELNNMKEFLQRLELLTHPVK